MTWRLEPSPRAGGIEEGLSARIHDPLWLLARQWQVGEFRGQDAGTPAVVQVAGKVAPVADWRGARQTEWSSFDGAAMPLDALVEAEDRPVPDLRERLEAGAHFRRLLAAAGLGRLATAFAAAHSFDRAALADPAFASDPLLAALARRTADGLALHATALALDAGGVTARIQIDANDVAKARSVATEWLAWYAAEIAPRSASGTSVTWQEHRLEYGFALSSAAGGGTVLAADGYLGDGIDWYDFDVDRAAATAPVAAGAAPVPFDRRAIPTPLRYGGMPLSRFWAMEDARVDFGSIDAAPNDVARLLLVEFGTVYGNDWYVLPMKLPIGSLTVLDTVVVTDTFGRNLLVERAGDGEPQWQLFSLSTKDDKGSHPAQRALFLPPSSPHPAQSDPVETVLFLRDEMADLAWGVEARFEDHLGRSVDRRAAWVGNRTQPQGEPARPAYSVETIVPDYWIPLTPELDAKGAVRLRLVPMEADDGGTPRPVEPDGRLLVTAKAEGRLWVFEEEVPREGTLVNRVRRCARWYGGETLLWTARCRTTGRGEGSSGLRFDVLHPE